MAVSRHSSFTGWSPFSLGNNKKAPANIHEACGNESLSNQESVLKIFNNAIVKKDGHGYIVDIYEITIILLQINEELNSGFFNSLSLNRSSSYLVQMLNRLVLRTGTELSSDATLLFRELMEKLGSNLYDDKLTEKSFGGSEYNLAELRAAVTNAIQRVNRSSSLPQQQTQDTQDIIPNNSSIDSPEHSLHEIQSSIEDKKSNRDESDIYFLPDSSSDTENSSDEENEIEIPDWHNRYWENTRREQVVTIVPPPPENINTNLTRASKTRNTTTHYTASLPSQVTVPGTGQRVNCSGLGIAMTITGVRWRELAKQAGRLNLPEETITRSRYTIKLTNKLKQLCSESPQLTSTGPIEGIQHLLGKEQEELPPGLVDARGLGLSKIADIIMPQELLAVIVSKKEDSSEENCSRWYAQLIITEENQPVFLHGTHTPENFTSLEEASAKLKEQHWQIEGYVYKENNQLHGTHAANETK